MTHTSTKTMPFSTRCSLTLRGFLLPAMLPLTFALGCGGTRAVVKAATPDPETMIAAMLQTEQAAWNANDNATYGSVYTDDADFINIRGQIFTGRTAITQVHGMIFAGPFKGSTIQITTRLFKILSPGVVMVDTDQEVTNFAFLPPGIVPTTTGTLLTHFKYIAAQQTDGSWKFISGQNTSALPN
jgi:uncharacterized protein (TIGR02246 family)